MSKTRDEFLDAFLKVRNSSPEVTAEQFLAHFDEIPNLLENLGIELDDRTAEEIIGDRDVDRECEIVDQAAAKTRGWGKSKPVCLHDVCHRLLIQEERRSGRKAWFLTRDKTLSQAAIDLGGDQPPFFFPLAGFLQSVSPFLEAPEVQRSLVDLFSAVLDGEIGDLSGESLFNLSELKIISEFHTDVFSTPVEQLVPAFDHVKSNVLSGKLYQRDDHTKVALELKKWLFRVFSGWPTGSRLLHPADPTSPAVTSEPKRRPRNPQIPYTPVRSWATRKGNKTLINRELSL